MTGSFSADASGVLADLRRRYGDRVPPDVAFSVGTAYLNFIRDRFERYASSNGDWTQLAESTKREKIARGYPPDKINIRSGRLLNSFEPGDTENVLLPQPDGVLCGTSVPYAEYVQAVRAILVDPDAETEAEIARILSDALQNP